MQQFKSIVVECAHNTLHDPSAKQKCIDGALHLLLDRVEQKGEAAAEAQKVLTAAHSTGVIISTSARRRYDAMVAAISLGEYREKQRILNEKLAADRARRAVKQARNKDNRAARGVYDRSRSLRTCPGKKVT